MKGATLFLRSLIFAAPSYFKKICGAAHSMKAFLLPLMAIAVRLSIVGMHVDFTNTCKRTCCHGTMQQRHDASYFWFVFGRHANKAKQKGTSDEDKIARRKFCDSWTDLDVALHHITCTILVLVTARKCIRISDQKPNTRGRGDKRQSGVTHTSQK